MEKMKIENESKEKRQKETIENLKRQVNQLRGAKCETGAKEKIQEFNLTKTNIQTYEEFVKIQDSR